MDTKDFDDLDDEKSDRSKHDTNYKDYLGNKYVAT